MPWLSEDQKSWFEGFIARSESDLCAVVAAAGTRFPTRSHLLERYREAAQRLLQTGVEAIDDFNAVHNELCLAATILEATGEPRCSQLDYELSLQSCDKKFDFCAIFPVGDPKWIEVKTIQPKSQDDWAKYKAHIEAGRFPDNARLGLSEQWLGGELYHNAFSARSRILEYTVETEEKITACLTADGDRGVTMLALFSNGFDWHIEELEDFVFYYRRHRHYDGDHFRLMEAYEIEQRQLVLLRNIDYFTFIERPITEVRPKGGAWDVKPPTWPPN